MFRNSFGFVGDVDHVAFLHAVQEVVSDFENKGYSTDVVYVPVATGDTVHYTAFIQASKYDPETPGRDDEFWEEEQVGLESEMTWWWDEGGEEHEEAVVD